MNKTQIQQKGLLTGLVVGNKMSSFGTLKVAVETVSKNSKYKKNFKKIKNYIVQYNEKKDIEIGRQVVLCQIAPVSKLKIWMVFKINDLIIPMKEKI